GMRDKPMIVALNKIDLPEAQANLPRLREVLGSEGFRLLEISAATGEGVTELMNVVGEWIREIHAYEAAERGMQEEKPKRRVYTIGDVDEQAWTAVQTGPDHFVVSGVGIERFTK